jgi:general secretion pathway protein G
MNLLLLLALFLTMQDVPKRDEIFKQDVENAIKKLGSNRYTESYVAKTELEELGRRVIPAVVAELNRKDAKPEVKRACCEILGAVRDGHKDAVAALIARLKDTEEYGVSIASAAVCALVQIGDESAIPAILEILKSKAVETDLVLKHESIRAMGLFRVKEAAEPLKKALEDKRSASVGESADGPLVAVAAVDALGLIRAQDALEELSGKLNDTTKDPLSDQTMAVHAARALQRILEHELRGKDEPRAGVLAGEEGDVKKTLESWQKWANSRKAKKEIEETRGRITKVVAAVEAFKKEQGSYPATLEQLKTKPELRDAWGTAFVYRAPGSGADFDIVSYGADRAAFGSGDDGDLWNHDKWREVRKAETKKALEETVKVINQFKADNDRYPEKLLDLVSRPGYTLKTWPPGGYLKEVPKDGYNNYLVFYPGRTPGEPFDLVSAGADRMEGGVDENEDLWNHDKRPAKKDEKK